MKKLIITALVLISFLLGNASMLAGIVKVFGYDSLKPVLSDLLFEKVSKILYGEAPSKRPLGHIAYDQVSPRIARAAAGSRATDR